MRRYTMSVRLLADEIIVERSQAADIIASMVLLGMYEVRSIRA